MADPTNPDHYKSHPSGIECIEVTRHMSFNIGNAIKYLWRCDLKNGVEDLRKALWYVNDEIMKRGGENQIATLQKPKRYFLQPVAGLVCINCNQHLDKHKKPEGEDRYVCP